MKLRKIFDEEAIRPKPGLSAEQMPAEVEDPFTGEMKPYKGGKVKEEKASKKDKVKDASSLSVLKKLVEPLGAEVGSRRFGGKSVYFARFNKDNYTDGTKNRVAQVVSGKFVVGDKSIESGSDDIYGNEFVDLILEPIRDSCIVDAVSQSEQMKLYNALSRQLPRLINKIYPTHKDSVDDLVTEAFISFVQPKTSDEDIQKLIAEDEAKGISHSMNWYKYEQTKYPKEKAKIEQFDAEKIGGGSDAFDKFVAILVRNFLINKVRTDKELNVSKNDEGKNVYTRVARTESMDKGVLNSEGDVYNPVLAEVEEKVNSDEHTFDLDAVIEAIKKKPADKRRDYTERLLVVIHELPVGYSEAKRMIEEVYEALGKPVHRVIGTGGYARTAKRMEELSKGDFPFGIEPKEIVNANHERTLRFDFPSRQEAIDAAEKYKDVMERKGFVLNKIIGSKLSYKLK